MSTKNLGFSAITDMFGTSVQMVSDDGKHQSIIAERLPSNPMEKMVDMIDGGYMFRSPGISTGDWQPTLESLIGIEGTFSLSATMNADKKNSITALISFSDKNDATMFAWTNMDVWQKWSKEKEAEEQARIQDSSKPVAEVDENGNIKVKVTVTTLGD